MSGSLLIQEVILLDEEALYNTIIYDVRFELKRDKYQYVSADRFHEVLHEALTDTDLGYYVAYATIVREIPDER